MESQNYVTLPAGFYDNTCKHCGNRGKIGTAFCYCYYGGQKLRQVDEQAYLENILEDNEMYAVPAYYAEQDRARAEWLATLNGVG